jgi:hypothetical protein
MFLRSNRRSKDGKDRACWPLGRQYARPMVRGKGRCVISGIRVFNEQGEAPQRKLFPAHVEPPADDRQVARVLLNQVRLERTRQFGACWLGLGPWRRLDPDCFFEEAVNEHEADVPWSRVAAVLAISRLCAPGSELAMAERWYPSTALDDLVGIAERRINDTPQ